MRLFSLLFAGLSVSLGIILLNTQVGSLPGSDPSASSAGVVSATLLSTAQEDAVEQQGHAALNVEERLRKRLAGQPIRRVITKSAALPKVTPQKRPTTLLAAIDQADIQQKHKEIANDVLMALPPQCRNTLKNFYVKYEKQEHRGLAGKSVMILDGTVADAEFRALFVHESGHNWDLGCLRGTQASGKSAFSDGDEPIYKDDPSLNFYRISWITSSVQKSNANPEDFVSGYASYNIFEDFAESFAYFVLQNDVFAERAQENEALAMKYAFFRDVLFDGNIPQLATGKSVYKGKAPWDVTKLAYSWHPGELAIARK